MNTPNTTEYATVAAKQIELTEGLFVLELEERLEMAEASGDVITVRCV